MKEESTFCEKKSTINLFTPKICWGNSFSFLKINLETKYMFNCHLEEFIKCWYVPGYI